MSAHYAVLRQYGCNYCDLRFKDATSLKRHTNLKHTQEETHVCDHCASVFYAKYKLDVHLASKHSINDQFKCGKCKKFLMSERTLKRHERKCSTKKCPVCEKEFLSKWKLANHVKGHTNNRNHICDECGKDFLHGPSLVEHIEIVHQGKRPFECSTCLKTFSRGGSLRTHKLIHSGIKPFSCQLCDKQCREKIQLIKHLQSKHGVESSQIQNYVKLMPKKEIVQSQEMQNILQHLTTGLKTESDEQTLLSAIPPAHHPIDDIPASLIKSEPVEEVDDLINGIVTKECTDNKIPLDTTAPQNDVISELNKSLATEIVTVPDNIEKDLKFEDIREVEEACDKVERAKSPTAPKEFVEKAAALRKELFEDILESGDNLEEVNVKEELEGFSFESIKFC